MTTLLPNRLRSRVSTINTEYANLVSVTSTLVQEKEVVALFEGGTDVVDICNDIAVAFFISAIGLFS